MSHFCISSRLVFEPALEEPGTDLEDSGEDEPEGGNTNNVVTFKPDIEACTKYQIETPLLHTMEEVRKLGQMRRIDYLGYSILNWLFPEVARWCSP